MSALGTPRRLAIATTVIVALVAAAAGSCNPRERLRCKDAPPIEPGSVVINEIFFQFSTAADAVPDERVNFVELAGPPGTDLSCLDLVGVNGNDCSLYNPISLSGHTIPESGIFLIAEEKREWTLSTHSECPPGEALYTDPDTGERVCGPDPCDPNPCTEPNKGVCARSMPDEPTYRCSCDHGYYPDEDESCIENPIYERADLVHANANYRTGPDALVLIDLAEDSVVVDSVTYSDRLECPAVAPALAQSTGPARPPSTRESVARCTGMGEAYDEFVNTWDNHLDWNRAAPTPGEPNIGVICPDPCGSPPLPGDVVFTEISPRPHGPQWVELLNVTEDRSVSLCNCWLADTAHEEGSLSLASTSTLEWGPAMDPGDYAVLAKTPFDPACPDVPVDYLYGAGVNFRVTAPDAALLVCAPMPGRPMPEGATVWEGSFSGDNTGSVEEVYEVARVEFLAEELERGYSYARYSDDTWGRTWDGPFCTTEDGADHGSPRMPNEDPPYCPCPGDIVMTEMMFDPDGGGSEWFELYNAGEEPASLHCYSVLSQRWEDDEEEYDLRSRWDAISLEEPPILEPGERVVVDRGDCEDLDIANCVPLDGSFYMYATDEGAFDTVCTDSSGVERMVDRAAYNRSIQPRKQGYSLQLDERYVDSDEREYWYRWCRGENVYETIDTEDDGIVENHGSPGTENHTCLDVPNWPAEGDLVITEIMGRSRSHNNRWFEVHNPGDAAWSLDGCTVKRTGSGGSPINRHTLPVGDDVVVEPDEWFVFAARDHHPCPNDTPCVRSTSQMTFTDQDTISIECPRLDDPTGEEKATVDEVEYDYADFGASTNWRTLMLRPDRLASAQYPDDWYLATDDHAYEAFDDQGEPEEGTFEYGTPGEENPPEPEPEP